MMIVRCWVPASGRSTPEQRGLAFLGLLGSPRLFFFGELDHVDGVERSNQQRGSNQAFIAGGDGKDRGDGQQNAGKNRHKTLKSGASHLMRAGSRP